MNIKEAKNEIKKTVSVYLEKDEYGEYLIPTVRQRPVFMVGAPGIGKTAIIEQIAAELDLALVSYSMTHHTRQSAIGLPYLSEKQYLGKTYTISEYTMSEIIASVYEVMEKSGKKEGILFLDEINCVSETLAPSMLLFLQYKRFGNQQIPEGWVVVTAGNPPQFNKSVKEFDVATLDRLKVFDVESDFGIWKEYAYHAGIHPAIIAFLELNENCFYKISSTANGKKYITARGWEDLSSALFAYERNEYEVELSLVMQYITDNNCARKFTVYYDLFQKYRLSYSIADIMKGHISDHVVLNARKAPFDERLSIISMLMEGINQDTTKVVLDDAALQKVVKALRVVKKGLCSSENIYTSIQRQTDEISEELKKARVANALSQEHKIISQKSIRYLEGYRKRIDAPGTPNAEQFKTVKAAFTKDINTHDQEQKNVSKALKSCFEFIETTWGNGQEMVLFVTELTVSKMALQFISSWGCDKYFQYNGTLMVYDQEKSLMDEVNNLLDNGTFLEEI